MKVKVKVEGLKELEKALSELPVATRRNVAKRALMEAAKPMVDEAKQRAPVLSGHLQTSVTSGKPLSRRQRKEHQRKSDLEVFVGPDAAPQGVMQEFGTVDHPAQPFLRPAFDNHVQAAIRTVGGILGREIEKAAARIARKQARLLAKSGG